MVELIRGLSAERVRANLERVRAEIEGCGRDPSEVEILAAVKYVADEELEVLAEAGIELVGENRAQDLERRADPYGEWFAWDFIGTLQSRKVRAVLPHVRYIHSVATDSALRQLERFGGEDTEILVEVNVSGEEGRAGVPAEGLGSFLERSPVRVLGLMTMPPLTTDPERSRPYFASLSRLAERHGVRHLSMGTSQDYVVAVQEGATIVRLGMTLYGPRAS